jgi:DNA-binding response OmpR family regulator
MTWNIQSFSTRSAMETNALKILLVEDDDDLRGATLAFLQRAGHFVRGVTMAEELQDVAGGFIADVYLVDINLPDEDGLSLTKRLRASHPSAGIIITTGRTHISDKVAGHESGADFYLTKPVDPDELIAFVNSLGKRKHNHIEQDNLMKLDLVRRQLLGPNGAVDLTTSDTLILNALIRAPGQSLERWQIGELINDGKPNPPSRATIEMRITRLRRKLASAGAPSLSIKSEYKIGYTLCCSVVIR